MIAIRDLTAQRGEKKHGWLTIGETASGPLRVPIVLINGRETGPVLCVTAGVHATEYAPIDAVMRLLTMLDPERLHGTVIGEHRTGFTSPLDGLNLNRIAPGRQDGSISEVLADILLREVIAAAQYHIDFHAGDLGEQLLPFAGYSLTGRRELDAKGEALARAFTPRLISLSTDDNMLPPFPGSLNYAATRMGVVSILAEAGGNGTLDEPDVQTHLEGAESVMRHLGMIDGHAANGSRVAARSRTVIRAKRSGLVRIKVAIGDEITLGQEVAEIVGVFGDVVERVASSGQGLVGLIWTHKVVNTGDPIVRYWVT
jgi:hypothetical protein